MGESRDDIFGRPVSKSAEVDLLSYHERNAGRLVLDPKEAQKELGSDVASLLKLTADGTCILWPQPTADPEDPQNWSDRRKSVQLLIITLASIVPDFVGSIGVAAIFPLAKQYNTTPNHVNEVASNWAVFLLGWGGFAAVILVRRWGRLPILFWSQLLALVFLAGATFAPSLTIFAALRCAAAFFGTAPQITGLYTIADMYPFHLQCRKLNTWTMGFIMSPFVSPFFLGFLVAHANYKWAFAVGCLYSLVVLLLIIFLGEETLYDRTLQPIPPRPTVGLRYRVETLLGITGFKMAGFRPRWRDCIASPLRVLWRPHGLLIMIFGGMEFGLSIGITITNAIFLGTPPPTGFGFSQTAISASYATPIVATVVGELIGRFGNDLIASVGIRRNHGVFEAEMRLWMCYLSLPLYLAGFLLLGWGFQTLNLPAVLMGWGIGMTAIMLNTTAIYAYLKDCFPAHQGEVSALFNFFRTICGFAVIYFQAPWLESKGGMQVFGCEAAIVGCLFILVVPLVQRKGAWMRARFSMSYAPPPAPRTVRLSQRRGRQSVALVPEAEVPGIKLTTFLSPSMEGLELTPLPGGDVKTNFPSGSTGTVGVP
ncbi:major facilitator superfamily domain-containing protein [Mycena pura]|uniref:Major facilitator superfamily domain-containing protein n=1 Tax=Mycena pura TaxID=153505 RepID=A0AAD6V8J1_9AGAR|nr:major facilitator superfamily domain-containing protein [Mycena pura]